MHWEWDLLAAKQYKLIGMELEFTVREIGCEMMGFSSHGAVRF